MNGTLWGREPALYVGVVTAVLNLLTAFGVQIGEVQQAAIVQGTVAIISLIVGAVVVRRQVTSPATLAAKYEPKHGRD